MFQFSRFALHDYVFIMQYCINAVGFPIRISVDNNVSYRLSTA